MACRPKPSSKSFPVSPSVWRSPERLPDRQIRFGIERLKRTWIWCAVISIASLAAVIAMGDAVEAAGGRNERLTVSADRPPDEPIMAIVSLRNQRITVYDAKGSITAAIPHPRLRSRQACRRR